MKPRYKKLIAIVAGVAILTIAGLLVLNAFRNNLVYFFSPSEVLEARRLPRVCCASVDWSKQAALKRLRRA